MASRGRAGWFWRYPMWRATAFLQDFGWRTYFYGFTLGQYGFGMLIRRRDEERAMEQKVYTRCPDLIAKFEALKRAQEEAERSSPAPSEGEHQGREER